MKRVVTNYDCDDILNYVKSRLKEDLNTIKICPICGQEYVSVRLSIIALGYMGDSNECFIGLFKDSMDNSLSVRPVFLMKGNETILYADEELKSNDAVRIGCIKVDDNSCMTWANIVQIAGCFGFNADWTRMCC